MKIAVHTLRPESVQLEAVLTPKELGLDVGAAAFDAPVHVRVKVTRMHEDVLAQGEASATARLECSRCLAETALALTGTFDALFVPQKGAHGTRTGRRDAEWAAREVNFYDEGTIDLSDEIRECLTVELPLKPLCKPECAGLCPTCGDDLNDGPCGCKPEADDGPWAALRDLIPPE